MMVALFFHFSKRINSTKRPNDADGAELHISIRGNVPSGQLSSQSGTEYFDSKPTIWVSGNSNYNYVKLSGRYYFVRDRQREINDATVYYLEEDYGATAKEAILNTTAKVIYSSSNYDLNIDDIRNQETESTTLAQNAINFPLALDFQNGGTYLVSIAGGSLVTTTYVMNPALLKVFVDDYIYGRIVETPNDDIISQSINQRNSFLTSEQATVAQDWEALNSLKRVIAEWAKSTSNGLINQVGGVFDSIKDIKWSPFAESVHYHPGSASWYTDLYLGTINTGQRLPYAYGVLLRQDGDDLVIPIPHQGDYYQRDKRFSSYGIYIPFCGQFALSNDDVYNEENLVVNIGLDRQTGGLAGCIRAGSNLRRILSFSGESAKSVIHAVTDNATMLSIAKNTATGIIDTITGSITGGAMGAAKAGGNSISRLISGIDQTNVISGGSLSSGAGVAAGTRIVCFSTMKGKADDFEAIKDVNGLQCHKTLQLGTLTGYCLCDHASVDMDGTLYEKEAVNNLLNTGFYIE